MCFGCVRSKLHDAQCARQSTTSTCHCVYKIDCYPKGCAAPGNVQGQCNAQGLLSKLEEAPSHRKIDVTSKSPVGDISVVTLIRTDTTLDHSQKAEKVCSR
jgi:hypothetical protein